jgi:hypothetical protein
MNRSKFFPIAILLIFTAGTFFLASRDKPSQEMTPDDQLGITVQDKISIAYCPTMQRYIHKLDKSKYTLMPATSSYDALLLLASGQTDVALIGRRARSDEKSPGTQELLLAEGYTLVRSEFRSIQRAELSEITIHTALNEDLVNSLIPEARDVKLYESQEEAFLNGYDEAVLISWADFRDEHELLIPMDGSLKAWQFRSPNLYHNGVEQIDTIVEELAIDKQFWATNKTE